MDYLKIYKKQTVLITGGAGAIGSNLARKLAESGAEKVIILDDLSASYEWNIPNLPFCLSAFKLYSKPKAIVFYCGSNDLAGLKTPEEVFSDFQYFLTAISQHLPEAKLFVIGVKPSPSREYQKNKQISLNNMIKNLSDTNESLYFLDVRPSMLLTSGKADPSLFVKDMLHMNKKGYEVWTRIVKTALIENL